MTREEAIEFVKEAFIAWESEYRVPHEDWTETYKARDMAIEALKAEPIRCGECENYIDRRCIEANHHVVAHENCMNVFGAKRREL